MLQIDQTWDVSAGQMLSKLIKQNKHLKAFINLNK